MFKKIIAKYKERYVIDKLDLADSGETNRLNLLVLGPALFFFGVLDLIIVIAFHFNHLRDYVVSLIYFGIYTVFGAYVYIYSKWVKVIPRNKAYIWKTIPVYNIVNITLWAGVYNFYKLNQPFNGVLVFCLVGLIAVCVFSFSPLYFLLALSLAMSAMIPGIYNSFGVTALLDCILLTIMMFVLSLYKRRVEKKYIMMLRKQKLSLEAKTFGNFTLIYNNKVINFSRSKSLELMGYLIYKRGTSVQSKELISVLWGDRADSARYGSSLRNLIVDVKHTMSELEIQNFFIAEYNNFRINPESIKCDYYDFLEGDTAALKSFAGEFMSQFSWAEEVAGFLEQKALGK
ncbi:MAG: hypothetical protein J5710_08350 [Treponema sp.]|nr:hypothetical protein [Treponema sp.]